MPQPLNPGLAQLASRQHGMFTWSQAMACGYSKHVIRGHAHAGRWQRVHYGVYVAQAESPSFWQRCFGTLLAALTGSAISGRSALRAHGVSVMDRYYRVEVRPPLRIALTPSRDAEPDDPSTAMVRGVRVVRPAIACMDVARADSLALAVAALDEVLRRGIATREELELVWATLPAGTRGRRTARRALDLADPRAESPPESMLRVAMVTAGLPTPEVQIVITDANGAFVARTDLGYSKLRLAIEYDGAATHRDDPHTFREDRRRQNRLLAEGWTVLRFTGADLFGQPETMIATIREALHAARRRDRSLPA